MISPSPPLPTAKYASAVFSGSKSAKSRDPSSGGIGIRLRIARRRFQLIIVVKIKPKIPDTAICPKLCPAKRI